MIWPGFQLDFNFDDIFSDKEVEEIIKYASEEDSSQRKDYCYRCKNDELYWHAMTAKCSKCHEIVLGGE